MTLDDWLGIGEVVPLGAHRFEAGAIKAFAAKYDPQRFHLDEEAARRSVLGGLCASGWHTAAVWMKLNVAATMAARPWAGAGPQPVFGPSPGFRKLKWPRPVYAGKTVAFTRAPLLHRPLASRPGWRMLSFIGAGALEDGTKVLEFEGAVLVRTG